MPYTLMRTEWMLRNELSDIAHYLYGERNFVKGTLNIPCIFQLLNGIEVDNADSRAAIDPQSVLNTFFARLAGRRADIGKRCVLLSPSPPPAITNETAQCSSIRTTLSFSCFYLIVFSSALLHSVRIYSYDARHSSSYLLKLNHSLS